MARCPHHKVFDQDCGTCTKVRKFNIVLDMHRTPISVLAPFVASSNACVN